MIRFTPCSKGHFIEKPIASMAWCVITLEIPTWEYYGSSIE